MKKLYVVNNGGAYSDNCTYLVEADSREWLDLTSVLLLCGEKGEAKITAEATAYSAIRTCEPHAVSYPSSLTRWHGDHLRANPRGIAEADARKLLSAWKADARTANSYEEEFSTIEKALATGKFSKRGQS